MRSDAPQTKFLGELGRFEHVHVFAAVSELGVGMVIEKFKLLWHSMLVARDLDVFTVEINLQEAERRLAERLADHECVVALPQQAGPWMIVAANAQCDGVQANGIQNFVKVCVVERTVTHPFRKQRYVLDSHTDKTSRGPHRKRHSSTKR